VFVDISKRHPPVKAVLLILSPTAFAGILFASFCGCVFLRKMIEYSQKECLRESILVLLHNQQEEERRIKSKAIKNKLVNLKEFQEAEMVFFYASFDGEVDTFEMIKQTQKLGKKIGLPRTVRGDKQIIPAFVEYLDRDLEKGPYGIKQPKETCPTLSLENIDVVIVPGVAFDRQNNRLGRGGGYYDRFLKKIPSEIPTIGLAFDFQVVDHLPEKEPHDMPVSSLITN